MKLRLVETVIDSVNFVRLENKLEDREKDFSLEVSNLFPKENSMLFGVYFDVQILNPAFDMDVKSIHWFQADTIIDERFQDSPFSRVNAPAIAFPYLRAFISTFTINAGYTPIILPSLNFVDIEEKRKAGQEVIGKIKLVNGGKKKAQLTPKKAIKNSAKQQKLPTPRAKKQ